MIFIDPAFLFLFLPIFLSAFFISRKLFGADGAIFVVFLGSLICYAPWGLLAFLLLLTSIAINFTIGTVLVRGSGHGATRFGGALYYGGQAYNFLALIWFKYQFIQYWLATSGAGHHFVLAAIPAGISFYTFHQAAFLADARRGEPSAVAICAADSLPRRVRAFVRYGAFVTFFPQMIIGPITYMKEFLPQVRREEFGRFHAASFSVGIFLIASGTFKKLFLADNLNLLVVNNFSAAHSGAPLTATAAWFATMGYYAQLYFDFSGYSDIALGLARLCGLRYPINFYSPLKAVGILDFYRRWHMTLTRVISRFVFTPLSVAGTRRSMRMAKPWRKALSLWLPLLVNFELIALWHGATATFVVFGLLHGSWYVIETEVRATRWFKNWRKRSSERLRAVLGRLIFVLPMMLTFALFRSQSLEGFARLLAALVGQGGAGAVPAPFDWRQFAFLGFSFFVIGVLPNNIELLRRYRPGIMTFENPLSRIARLLPAWRPNWAWALLAGVLFVSGLAFIARQPPFLYQGF